MLGGTLHSLTWFGQLFYLALAVSFWHKRGRVSRTVSVLYSVQYPPTWHTESSYPTSGENWRQSPHDFPRFEPAWGPWLIGSVYIDEEPRGGTGTLWVIGTSVSASGPKTSDSSCCRKLWVEDLHLHWTLCIFFVIKIYLLKGCCNVFLRRDKLIWKVWKVAQTVQTVDISFLTPTHR